ncbi:DUF2935 domain-containing protein [Paenibacillus sp. 1P07SE]|uniref:DUF2935 domain-containing protein n=1 Tax=Paenibacillus sp. 1P07SE TaxID=3132209 RepID=UPI0039A730AF
MNQGPWFEHRFWLQIMGDHARMIEGVLAPAEKADVTQARQFRLLFDDLLAKARGRETAADLAELNEQAEQAVTALRGFKLSLLERLILGKVRIGFTPSFLNHMVNELEEYQRILQALLQGKGVPEYHPLHHDLLWLQDAIGHAAGIGSDLDLTEQQLINKSRAFEDHFEAFYLKAVEMAGYMRTGLKDYPAFRKYHKDVDLEMRVFMHFLQELEEMQLSAETLDRITPLIPDHMYREECYYLTKLAQSGMVPDPKCDPAKPRVAD